MLLLQERSRNFYRMGGGGGGVQTFVQKGLLDFVVANYSSHKSCLHIIISMMFQFKKPASLIKNCKNFSLKQGSGLIARGGGGSSGSPGPYPWIRHCFASTIYKSLAQT